MQTILIRLLIVACFLGIASESWAQKVNLQSNVTGILPQANGGTGATSIVPAGTLTNGDLCVYASTPAINCNVAQPTGTLTGTVATGTITLNPGALTTGTCSSAIDGGTATGVLTTDNIDLTANADLTATTGYTGVGTLVTLYKYPTAGHVNVKVCNWTSGSITPTSTTWNWKVWR